MQIQELRIGNWVMYKPINTLIKVGLLILGEIQESNSINNKSDFEPIPLTEEILLKCGASIVLGTYNYYISLWEIKSEIHFELFRDGYVCVIYSSTGSVVPNDIEYLHQLQNLFYSLVGEELQINL